MHETRAHATCVRGHRRWIRWWEGEDQDGRWYAAAVLPQEGEEPASMPTTDGDTPPCPCGAAWTEIEDPEAWW